MANFRLIFRGIVDLPTTLGRPLSRAYLPELDGLRFIALFVVMLWHASIRASRYHAGVDQSSGADGYFSMLPHGEIGVLLFFFISGFVVSQPFLNRPSSDWGVRLFYIRRFIRIYPPYLIALSLCFFALGILGYVPVDANSYNSQNVSLTSSYLASVFYIHGYLYNVASRLDPPIWSLELEIVFYAIAPLLLYFYTRIRSRPVRQFGLGLVVLMLLAATAVVTSQLEIDGRYRWGLLCHGYLFLLGILAADITGETLAAHARRKSVFADLIFLAGCVGLAIIGLEMTASDARLSGGWPTVLLQLATIVSLACVFVGAFYGTASSWFLSLGWIRFIGTMCYSIYLTHIVAMQACGEILAKTMHIDDPSLIWGIYFIVLIPMGIGVGLIFYVCIERPFAALAASTGRSKAVYQAYSQPSSGYQSLNGR